MEKNISRITNNIKKNAIIIVLEYMTRIKEIN